MFRKLTILLALFFTFSGASFAQVGGQSTPLVSGATDPATCDPTSGNLFFNTSTNPGVTKYCKATNVWAPVAPTQAPGTFNSNFDPPLFQNYSLTTTGAQAGINLTANPIDTHTISWRLSGSLATNITDAIAYSNGDLHTANVNWVYQTGTFNVSSNAAYGSSATSLAYRSDGANTANEFAQETVVETAGTGTQNHGPCVRVQVASFSGYCLLLANNNFRIRLWNAATPTDLATYDAQSPVTGDILKITAVGTTISAYKNGILIGSATDATFSTGETGIYSAGNSNSNGASNFQSGQIPNCTVALDSSADNSTWLAGGAIAAQNCGAVTSGSFQASAIANFVRVNVTALSSPLTLTVVYSGRLAPVAQVSGTGSVTNGQFVNQGEIIWTQVTSNAAGTVSVSTNVRIAQANGVINSALTTIASCSLSTSGGFGFGYIVPVSGWLQGINSQVNTAGFPQGAFYINHYLTATMPSGGTTNTCTSSFSLSSNPVLLSSGAVGSFYPVSFVGTSAIPQSPWSIPGFTTLLAMSNPAAGAEFNFAVPASGNGIASRYCIQSVSFQLVTSATVANRLPALVLTFTNGSATIPLVYSANTAQTAGSTQKYTFVPGSAEIVTTGATIYHVVPFNNGQLACFNAGLTGTNSITTLTAGIQAGDQYTAGTVLLQQQNDNN